MVRTVDYGTRKRAVLSAAINKYIEDAIPVASDDIAVAFSLSSATIRNIFAELEEDGFLRHPYTSGGRIPTDKGYRYYVDFLMTDSHDDSGEIELLDAQKEYVLREYKHKISRIEDVLEKTSEIVSALTHYTSVVSLLDAQDKFYYKGIGFILEHPEFRDFERVRYLIKMVEDKRRLLELINRDFKDKVKIYIGEELGWDEVNGCALAVSSYRVKNGLCGRLAVFGPMRMKYSHIVAALEYVSDALEETFKEMLD